MSLLHLADASCDLIQYQVITQATLAMLKTMVQPVWVRKILANCRNDLTVHKFC